MGYKIYFKYYLPQQKVLRKILEKVLVNKKNITHLTNSVFEIPENKNIGKLFSKYKLVFLDQANSSSDLPQILIPQFPTPRAFLPRSSSLSSFTLAN